MQEPRIQLKKAILRPWQASDAEALARHANNPRIASNLRDGFPYPYTLSDAKKWLAMVADKSQNVVLAIEVEGEAAGGIGLHMLKDVYRYNGEIGYWLSQEHWQKGIVTEAVAAMVEYAFTQTSLLRLFACIFENNPASMRVLAKNGFTLEAIHRKAVMKEGILMDEHLYSLLKENWKN
jgi:RimJ/RimL family protein N-acetyltransferase